MRHHIVDTPIHKRPVGLSLKELLLNLLDEEGDYFGWEEEELIYEASLKLEDSSENIKQLVRDALESLIRDNSVTRDRNIICLRD